MAAELTPRDRLQPCLLDRLTDDDPTNSRESRDSRVISVGRLRRAVLRDLSWLLNSTPTLQPLTENLKLPNDDEEFQRGEARMLVDKYPEVADSVVNLGLPDLCGQTSSSVTESEVERMVARAIEVFEPRILPNTIGVQAVVDTTDMSPNAMAFEIEGELWAQPVPEQLYFKTSIDLETGQYRIDG